MFVKKVVRVASFAIFGGNIKTKFSTKLEQYNLQKEYIAKFAERKEYNIENVSEFAATFGIPLYFVYYYFWKELRVEEAEKEMLRLMEFYQLEYDL